MQSLYTIETLQTELKPGEATKILQKHLDQTRELYVYLVYVLCEVARYTEVYARQKASKHLPTAEDLSINTKLAGNEVLWKIKEDPSYVQALVEFKPQLIDGTGDLVKKLYLELLTSEIYQNYLQVAARDKKEEKDILDYIFTDLMLPNDLFVSLIDEKFSNWDDDAEMLSQLVQQYINKPANGHFQDLISIEKRQYAHTLLRTVLDKQETNLELIKPCLKNWDADRIAILDMILMQMGLSEFLYFETIPLKVTINEYIDLAKEYSTPQSGQFVNGILDNLHKDLSSQGRLNKVDFK